VVAIVLLTAIVFMFRSAPRVETVSLERREVVETLVTTGRVRAAARVHIGTQIIGTVERVLVDEGARVDAGQPLITLNATELEAQSREARARLEVAEAALNRLRDVESPIAASNLRDAELELEQAERDLERYSRVLELGGVSEQRVDEARRAVEAARARYEQARIGAQSALGGADLRAAQANVAIAGEAYRAAASRLELSRITSPAAGRVLIRSVEPGDAVQPGRVLMELALDGDTELVVFPEERALGRIRPGQTAIASTDAFPGNTFHATVDRVGSVVDPQQGTVEVRLTVAVPPSYLVPDMTVSVNIETDRRPDALTLPREAVRAPLTDTAWVIVVREGLAERAPVTLGASDMEHVEILQGLRLDDQVVLRSAREITPGNRIPTFEVR
jgi:HlyD family secretion protein